MFHICDAPPHGKNFGDGDWVKAWKFGCPCKITEKTISKSYNKLDISYNLIAIGDLLEKMITMF